MPKDTIPYRDAPINAELAASNPCYVHLAELVTGLQATFGGEVTLILRGYPCTEGSGHTDPERNLAMISTAADGESELLKALELGYQWHNDPTEPGWFKG